MNTRSISVSIWGDLNVTQITLASTFWSDITVPKNNIWGKLTSEMTPKRSTYE